MSSEQFEVRLVPGLAKKPQGEGHSADSDRKKEDAAPSDPFAPPYIEELFVAEETVKEDENDAGETFVVLVRPLPSTTSEEKDEADLFAPPSLS